MKAKEAEKNSKNRWAENFSSLERRKTNKNGEWRKRWKCFLVIILLIMMLLASLFFLGFHLHLVFSRNFVCLNRPTGRWRRRSELMWITCLSFTLSHLVVKPVLLLVRVVSDERLVTEDIKCDKLSRSRHNKQLYYFNYQEAICSTTVIIHLRVTY